MRRVLNQAANSAARSKGTHFQAVFRRLLPRLGVTHTLYRQEDHSEAYAAAPAAPAT